MKEHYQSKEHLVLLDLESFLQDLIDEEDNDKRIEMINQKEQELLSHMGMTHEELEKQYTAEHEVYQRLHTFPDILFENDFFILRIPCEQDKDPYIELRKVNAYSKYMYKIPKLIDEEWAQHIQNKSLNYSIISKNNNTYIEYCGIHDLSEAIYEISIELVGDYQNKGYGYMIMNAFLEKVHSITGISNFSCRIDPDNVASQKLFEKIGFQPFGLKDFVFYTEEEKKQIEEQDKDRIDARYLELAHKFDIEPQKLLTHVLEYRLKFDKK